MTLQFSRSTFVIVSHSMFILFCLYSSLLARFTSLSRAFCCILPGRDLPEASDARLIWVSILQVINLNTSMLLCPSIIFKIVSPVCLRSPVDAILFSHRDERLKTECKVDHIKPIDPELGSGELKETMLN